MRILIAEDDRIIADGLGRSLRQAGYAAQSFSTTSNKGVLTRLRAGPFATRAEAEIVRVKALEVRSDVPVKVVALDAEPAPAPTPAAPAAPAAPFAGDSGIFLCVPKEISLWI